jgi:hypothetical protein
MAGKRHAGFGRAPQRVADLPAYGRRRRNHAPLAVVGCRRGRIDRHEVPNTAVGLRIVDEVEGNGRERIAHGVLLR